MGNYEIFKSCCKTLACLEQSINILKNIGLLVEPGNVIPPENDLSNCLYKANDGPLDVALSLLDTNGVDIENEITNVLLQMDLYNYNEIMEEVWNKYGIK